MKNIYMNLIEMKETQYIGANTIQDYVNTLLNQVYLHFKKISMETIS